MALDENLVFDGEWHLQYRYSAGRVLSSFFSALRDEDRILGARCPSCRRVYAPPRSLCERCFVELSELTEVGPGGTIRSFTIVYESFAGLPPPPYAIAYVQLDGADTALGNFVHGLSLDSLEDALLRLKVGARVRVRFADKREGRITDFAFECEEWSRKVTP